MNNYIEQLVNEDVEQVDEANKISRDIKDSIYSFAYNISSLFDDGVEEIIDRLDERDNIEPKDYKMVIKEMKKELIKQLK